MPADPTRAAPEWAVKMAMAYYRIDAADSVIFHANDLALLLASVRDAALREAAARCVHNNRGCGFNDDLGCHGQDSRSILALVGTAPKETHCAD